MRWSSSTGTRWPWSTRLSTKTSATSRWRRSSRAKPVITCRDSGGPTEFVVDGVNGFVCEPSARGHRRRDRDTGGRSAPGGDARRGGARDRRPHHVGWRHRKTGGSLSGLDIFGFRDHSRVQRSGGYRSGSSTRSRVQAPGMKSSSSTTARPMTRARWRAAPARGREASVQQRQWRGGEERHSPRDRRIRPDCRRRRPASGRRTPSDSWSGWESTTS